MINFRRVLLMISVCYTVFSAVILIKILHDYQFFYPSNGKWKLVWNDDFSGPALDRTKWSVTTRSTSLQEQVQACIPENISVKDGCLIIASKKEDWFGQDYMHPHRTITRHYTSGEVTTKNKAVWTYGRFEIRAKLPAGQGVSPFMLLLPNDNTWPPEIDIMVNFGQRPREIYFNNFWGKDAQDQHLDSSGPVSGQDYSADFHNYAVEWEPHKIQWYIDDILLYQTNRNIPNKPLLLVMGTGIGGILAGNPYNPNFVGKPSTFPQYLMIDRIRIYQRR
jgi:beta-glucanase (GH16 family)